MCVYLFGEIVDEKKHLPIEVPLYFEIRKAVVPNGPGDIAKQFTMFDLVVKNCSNTKLKHINFIFGKNYYELKKDENDDIKFIKAKGTEISVSNWEPNQQKNGYTDTYYSFGIPPQLVDGNLQIVINNDPLRPLRYSIIETKNIKVKSARYLFNNKSLSLTNNIYDGIAARILMGCDITPLHIELDDYLHPNDSTFLRFEISYMKSDYDLYVSDEMQRISCNFKINSPNEIPWLIRSRISYSDHLAELKGISKEDIEQGKDILYNKLLQKSVCAFKKQTEIKQGFTAIWFSNQYMLGTINYKGAIWPLHPVPQSCKSPKMNDFMSQEQFVLWKWGSYIFPERGNILTESNPQHIEPNDRFGRYGLYITLLKNKPKRLM